MLGNHDYNLAAAGRVIDGYFTPAHLLPENQQGGPQFAGSLSQSSTTPSSYSLQAPSKKRSFESFAENDRAVLQNTSQQKRMHQNGGFNQDNALPVASHLTQTYIMNPYATPVSHMSQSNGSTPLYQTTQPMPYAGNFELPQAKAKDPVKSLLKKWNKQHPTLGGTLNRATILVDLVDAVKTPNAPLSEKGIAVRDHFMNRHGSLEAAEKHATELLGEALLGFTANGLGMM